MAESLHEQALDPAVQFETLKASLEGQLQRTFPIRDPHGRFEVRVRDVKTVDHTGIDDIQEQQKAKLEGRSFSADVHGVVDVVDAATGKVLVSRGQKLAEIPKMTRHGTWIIGGQEMSLTNQWRLRPGAYVKQMEKEGQFEAQFQLAKGRSFDIQQEETGNLFMKVGGRKISLYNILKAEGVGDDEMRKAWGDAVYAATRKKAREKDLASFHEAWKKAPIAKGADPTQVVRELLASTKLDAEVAQQNLGVRSEAVNGSMLLSASRKLMAVAAGHERPDPIDSLRYKELWTAKDHMVERLARSGDEITARVQGAFRRPSIIQKIRDGKPDALRDVVPPDLLRRPLLYPFTSTTLASVPKQTNPVAMLADMSATTIAGPGGIQNEHQLNASNTAIDPSHLGFLDPVFTPESNPGVTTHLAFGVRPTKDRRPVTRMFNMRTGKYEDVDAVVASRSVVALPDQVVWKNGKPAPREARFRAIDKSGELKDTLKWSEVEYVLPSAAQVFATETNLVPFMQNDSAGRTTMSARHMAQAISVVGREAPLVRPDAGNGKSWEEVIGSKFLAHTAPVDGKVVGVSKTAITVQDTKGKKHQVALYDHYPTNDIKGMLHSTPLVKVGDRVKASQVVADHNFSKNGVLALGTNVRVAYLANGFNHEDGIVISESAARKLASEHLNKPQLYRGESTEIGLKEFINRKPGTYPAAMLDQIGTDGVVRVGAKVKPGQPLVLATSQRDGVHSISSDSLRRMSKRLRVPWENSSLVWDSPYEGTVVGVHQHGRTVTVHVKTTEPAQLGSKISTRHSAKGIVSAILPDKEMPVNEKGRHVEMLINPVSVPGRQNPGQILETVAGRIAEKTGKPYLVKNFDGATNYLDKVRGELKKHGISETEALFDPKTGRRLGDITVGPHYIFQLEHQIDKKTHVRGGGDATAHLFGGPKVAYDQTTKTPRGGGHHGAQSLGSLGMSAALASGLHENLQEMQTLKSDEAMAREAWGQIINGDLRPTPKVPFAYQRFEAMLRGMGVNLEKTGTSVRMIPRSDAETRAMSRGALKAASKTIRGKDDAPMKGGLFDGLVTGGIDGQHWSHLELVEPVPHPLYARPLAQALGIKEKDIPEILAGTQELPGAGVGPKAFATALGKLNVDKELAELGKRLADPNLKEEKLAQVNAQYKALRVLKEKGLKPVDAWMIKAVPVLPPMYRPLSTQPDGSIRLNPLNKLYRRLAVVNEQLEKGQKKGVPWAASLDTRAGLYQELSNLFGTVPKGKKALDLDFRGTKEDPGKKLPGIIHMIAGERPKDGFFQDKLISKKQDYTARATIIADPTLSADEVGVPQKVAIELMRPMVVARLKRMGRSTEDAQRLVSKRDPLALAALAEEVKHRPVLLKRDPVLHQYGLVGQNVKLIDSEAIKVSPLVLPPIGGDIDGDTTALFVPLTPKAIDEVKRIIPSNRTLSESSGDVLFAPQNEASLSLYRMSMPRKKSNLTFASTAEAEQAFVANKIDLDHQIHVKGVGDTTLGRVRVASVLPDEYKKAVQTDLSKPFGKKEQSALLHDVALKQPKRFLELADSLSRVGFQMAYDSGHSVTLNDLQPLTKERDAVIAATQKKVDALGAKADPDKVRQLWLDATKQLHDVYSEHHTKNPNNVWDMRKGGIKAKTEQWQGLVVAPMLVEDHKGKPTTVPVTRSFSEGIDVGGYFMQASGARRGVIQKVEAVREPGYMSKLLVRATIDHPVTGEDCGTKDGVSLKIDAKDHRDALDRFLAVDTKIGEQTYKAGTTVTPELVQAALKANAAKLVVRSPLKCRMPQGVCSKCMGVHPSGQHWRIGENAGLVSAQALGERAAQLMLKQTHGGGIVSLQKHTVADFEDVQKLFNASKPSLEDAAMAPQGGRVSKVEKLPQGTYAIHIEGVKNPLTTRQKPTIAQGATVERGQLLSEGRPNLHHVLAYHGHDAAQNHLADHIGDIYAREGVLRRHAELTARNAMGTVRISDPGGHSGVLRGDFMMKNAVDAMNRNAPSKPPVRYQSVVKPLGTASLERQPDWMARLGGESLAKSIVQAAQHGETSSFNGAHPLPSLAYGEGYVARRAHK